MSNTPNTPPSPSLRGAEILEQYAESLRDACSNDQDGDFTCGDCPAGRSVCKADHAEIIQCAAAVRAQVELCAGLLTTRTPPSDERRQALLEAAQLCAAEMAYWRDAENVEDGITIGAVGAASNCCAKIYELTNAAPQVPGNGAKADEGQGDRHRIVNTPADAAPVTRSESARTDGRPFGSCLATAILQSDLYRMLDTDARAECDELIERWKGWLKHG